MTRSDAVEGVLTEPHLVIGPTGGQKWALCGTQAWTDPNAFFEEINCLACLQRSQDPGVYEEGRGNSFILDRIAELEAGRL